MITNFILRIGLINLLDTYIAQKKSLITIFNIELLFFDNTQHTMTIMNSLPAHTNSIAYFVPKSRFLTRFLKISDVQGILISITFYNSGTKLAIEI